MDCTINLNYVQLVAGGVESFYIIADFLSVIGKEVLKFLTIIVDLSTFSFQSYQFSFHKFEALLFGVYIFRFLYLFDRLAVLSSIMSSDNIPYSEVYLILFFLLMFTQCLFPIILLSACLYYYI